MWIFVASTPGVIIVKQIISIYIKRSENNKGKINKLEIKNKKDTEKIIEESEEKEDEVNINK